MKANEAAELVNSEKEEDRYKQRAAVAIACLAMLLAITDLGGDNATKDALNNNILASNYMNFFQAKNMRQTSLILAAEQIEFVSLANPALPPVSRAALEGKLAEHRRTIARYESDPESGEGKKELLAKAREHEGLRDRALRQDPYFDYASTLMQIAIVLMSVAIVATQRWLAWVGGVLGITGAVLMLNGFTLWFSIPFLG